MVKKDSEEEQESDEEDEEQGSDEPEEEKDLEELTESDEESEDSDDFSDFISASSANDHAIDMGNPTLQTSSGKQETTNEPLEQTMGNLPPSGTPTEGDNQVYNLPEYNTGDYDTQQEKERAQVDAQMNVTRQQLRPEAGDDLRKINLNQWQENMVRGNIGA